MESAEGDPERRLQLQQQQDEGKTAANELKSRACRILVLGDGNFSFSLALARALPPSFEIVATSFDGPIDLLSKYPEAPGIVATLRSLGVTVLHNVDATALDARVVETPPTDGEPTQKRQYEHVIFNHPHTGTEDMRRHRSFLGHFFHAVARSTTSAATATVTRNPSAVGTDGDASSGGVARGGGVGGDVGAKASGAAHEHCGSILDAAGAVHVTLALDQPERWGLREQAARHGFRLAHRRRFPADEIDGYMTKRHQTGRSFQQRVQNSETLSFTWASGAEVDEAEPAAAGPGGCRRSGRDCSSRRGMSASGRGEGAVAAIHPFGSPDDGKGVPTGGSGGGTRSLPPWLWSGVRMTGDKEGAAMSPAALRPQASGNGDGGGSSGNAGVGEVDGADARTSAVDGHQGGDGGRGREMGCGRENQKAVTSAAVSLLREVCTLCGKRYKSAQALRTHTRQLHELGQEGGVPIAPKVEKSCPHPGCGRVFKSDRALDQHVSAKHSGENIDVKPDWFVGSIYHPEEPPPRQSDDGGVATGKGPSGSENPAANASALSTQTPATAGADSRGPDASETAPEVMGLVSGTTCGTASDSDGLCHYCEICGFWFASSKDAQQHLDNLRPPIEGAVARYDCGTCAKHFGSRRALLQHANFCGGGGGGSGTGGSSANHGLSRACHDSGKAPAARLSVASD